MEFFLHDVLPGVSGALLMGLLLLYRKYDQLRAQSNTNRDFIATYIRKAGRDRNDKARIPVDKAALMFELEAPEPRDLRPRKQHRHPAVGQPNRNRKSHRRGR